MANKAVGDRVWVPHEDHAWLCGKITKSSPNDAEISCEIGKLKLSAKDVQSLDFCGSHVDDNVENLVDLDELSEGAILHHVRKRFQNQQIYTHVGAILVAVNPFERLNIYNEEEIKKASNVVNTYPHVFITASVAYQQLRMNMKNQAVLISGESGAGKTETTKKVLTYLANVAPAIKSHKTSSTASVEPGIEEKILQSNPLLEALGNSKTLRNNNSSRFGKWMKVDFDHNFRIQGCEIVNYLLEKSRVVTQSAGERNYHIFYQLLTGCSSEFRSKASFLSPDQYNYLLPSGCYQIEGVDDASDFREVLEAMNTLQFTPDLQNQLLQVIAGVLWIGNITFSNGKTDGSSQVNQASSYATEKACELLGLQIDSFKFALTEKRVQMGRGSVVSIKLNPMQAMESKDTLSKALYSNMFDWVIVQVNTTLKTSEAPFSIGILDIFGFEVFDVNSFEQLCINYANEKLQFHFNEVIFNEEMKMYADEGVPSATIVFVDNGECVELIENRPIGLLSFLDEECSLGKATDLTYANKIEQAFNTNRPNANRFYSKHKTKPEVFTIHHFAGPVDYVVTNFLDKNRDTLSTTLQEVAMLSSLSLVSDLFASTAAVEAAASGGKQRQSKAQVKSTLGGQFRNQLIGLVTNLRLTEPHFVRCVKPNHQKKPQIFDGQLALRQLRYAGLFEAIRIRQSGYAYRVTHHVFARQFATLVDGLLLKIKSKEISDANACSVILNHVTDVEHLIPSAVWCVGLTKVFIKTNADRIQLERQRMKRVEVFIVRLQNFGRNVIAKVKLNQVKYEKMRLAQKQLVELKRQEEAVLVLQRMARGYVVRRTMRFMAELVNLRKYLSLRDVKLIEMTLENLQMILEKEATSRATATGGKGGTSKPTGGAVSVSPIFTKEIEIAKTMLKLIKIQDKYLKELERSIQTENISQLNSLLIKCERLDLLTHPLVTTGKEKLIVLYKKRNVMNIMIDFLKNENNDLCEVIPETLEQAMALGVDYDFIAKVQRIYESASPRLRARNKLRRAIEIIDYNGILDGMNEVEGLQSHYPKFGEMELKAGRSLLSMLEFEKQIYHMNSYFNRFILTDEILNVCHEICGIDSTLSSANATAAAVGVTATGTKTNRTGIGIGIGSSSISMTGGVTTAAAATAASQNLKSLKAKLFRLSGGSMEQMELIIRSYKWSKVYCTWKYPEVLSQKPASSSSSSSSHTATATSGGGVWIDDSHGNFFGLRPAEARSSIHVIRSLHQDIDIVLGEAPASIQAALGALNINPDQDSERGGGRGENEHILRRDRLEKEMSQRNEGKSSQKVILKSATPTLRAEEKVKNIEGRRTSYMYLPPSAEQQLLESRSSLAKQKKETEKVRHRGVRERHREWR